MIEDLTRLDLSLNLYKDQFLSTSDFSTEKQESVLITLTDFVGFTASRFNIDEVTKVVGYHLREYLRDIGRMGSRYRYDDDDDDDDRSIMSPEAALYSFFDYIHLQGVTKHNHAHFLKRYMPSNNDQTQDSDQTQDAVDNEALNNSSESSGDSFQDTISSTLSPQDNSETVLAVDAQQLSTEEQELLAHNIKCHLDAKVIGQENAKIQISVLLSMHLIWFKKEHRMHRSPNAILIGPTGVGKTHTIRVASEYLKIPFVAVDTTSLVPSGIVGYQIEEVLEELVRTAEEIIKKENRERYPDDDIELARRGIIFFDEFDKIAMSEDMHARSSVGGQSIQRRLLKLVEGAILGVGVRQRRIDNNPARNIDTSGILILAGGAFAGIDDGKIRAKRSEELKRDLAKSNPNVVVSADIINYGFMPELVARLPVLIEYKALDSQHLLDILDNPEVSPTQVWIEHFKQLGIDLIITSEAKSFIANKASSLKMGARGLQQVLFPSLAKIAYDIEISDEAQFVLTPTHFSQTGIFLNGGKSNAR